MIIGSGSVGCCRQSLKRADINVVTSIGQTNHHLFQPLLYQVATGVLLEGSRRPATRRSCGTRTTWRSRLAGDAIIDVSVPARPSPPGRPRVRRRSPTTASSSHRIHAVLLRQRPVRRPCARPEVHRRRPGATGAVLSAFEFAAVETDPGAGGPVLTFVVVGAGPTGVEMARQIAELARHTLRRDYRRIDPTQAHVILIDGAPTILASFDERLAAKATAGWSASAWNPARRRPIVDVDATSVECQARRTKGADPYRGPAVRRAGRRARRPRPSEPPGKTRRVSPSTSGTSAGQGRLLLPGFPDVSSSGRGGQRLPRRAGRDAVQRLTARRSSRRTTASPRPGTVPLPRQGQHGDDPVLPPSRASAGCASPGSSRG